METKYINNKVFFYRFVDTSYNDIITANKDIFHSAFNRWNDIIVDHSYNIFVDIYIDNHMSDNTLGTASVSELTSNNSYFNNTFPIKGELTININMLKDISNNINYNLYNIISHEIGHILGIGTLWDLSNSPIKIYDNDKRYYYGENALREYKNYFPDIQDEIIGIPIEDNGGEGTEYSHPEEDGINSNDKMLDL